MGNDIKVRVRITRGPCYVQGGSLVQRGDILTLAPTAALDMIECARAELIDDDMPVLRAARAAEVRRQLAEAGSFG